MKKINTLGVITGLTFIYVGIYVFLGLTSSNMAYKNNTYINKAVASIKVFENSLNNTEYLTGKTDLYDEKWTSNDFPNGSYSKVSIIYGNEGTPIPTSIGSSVTSMVRHSH